MKARIKHTDKIIDVEWNMFGWLFDSPEGKRIFNTEELDFLDNDNIDLESFRAEAAKDILCAMINHFGTKDIDMDDVMKWTNSLISKLKEKEKK